MNRSRLTIYIIVFSRDGARQLGGIIIYLQCRVGRYLTYRSCPLAVTLALRQNQCQARCVVPARSQLVDPCSHCFKHAMSESISQTLHCTARTIIIGKASNGRTENLNLRLESRNRGRCATVVVELCSTQDTLNDPSGDTQANKLHVPSEDTSSSCRSLPLLLRYHLCASYTQ
jgi:hypothetical protein